MDDDIVGATALQSDDWEDLVEMVDDGAAAAAPLTDIPGSNVINYMGIPLRETTTSTMNSITKLNRNERVILFQVDGVDQNMSNEAIAREWLTQLRDRRELPHTFELGASTTPAQQIDKRKRPLNINANKTRSFVCDYLRPLGDEWSMNSDLSQSEYIGDKFLGRVWITPGRE